MVRSGLMKPWGPASVEFGISNPSTRSLGVATLPSMWGIFTYIYHQKSTIYVGRYIPYMDAMGMLSLVDTPDPDLNFYFPMDNCGQSEDSDMNTTELLLY